MTDYLTPEQVSELTGRSVVTVRSWHKRGKLHAEMPDGRKLMFPKDDVMEFIREGRHIQGNYDTGEKNLSYIVNEANKCREQIEKLGKFCVANRIEITDLQAIVRERFQEKERKKWIHD